MNPINFNSKGYVSKYVKDGLKARNEAVSAATATETKKDTFNPKYKSKNRNNGFFATIALMAVSAFAAYKGKGKIQEAVKSVSSQVSNLKTKFPNLSQAFSSLKEACKTPEAAIKNVGTKIMKPLKAVGNFIVNLFSKKTK